MRRTDERGATLIVVLIFSVVFGLLVTALLTLTDTSIRAARSNADAGQRHASAEGATDTAISAVGAGTPCDSDITSPTIAGERFIVQCSGRSASSQRDPPPTLQSVGATDDEDGIRSTAPGLKVRGDVVSNSTITAGNGNAMTVSGDVSAVGICAQAVLGATAVVCADSGKAGEPLSAPDIDPPATVLPPLQAVPRCPTGNAWLVKLKPGYYDADAATALGALTDGSCRDVVLWFQPGVFYFDFTFGKSDPDGLWTVNDRSVQIIGGTPVGWDPTALSRPDIPASGSCATDQSGLQLMFGGGTRLRVDAGRVELCGSQEDPVIYGLPLTQGSHTLQPNEVSAFRGFSNPRRALTIGERPTRLTADAALAGGRDAVLQVGGFRPDVPPGAKISDLRLMIAHQEEGTSTALAVTSAFPDLDAGLPGCALSATGRGTVNSSARPVTDTIDLTACGLVNPDQLANFRATVTATAPDGSGDAIEHLDGIAIRVQYVLPTTFQPTAATSPAAESGDTDFTDADQGRWIDGVTAAAALTTNSARASINLAGFGQPPVPTGSDVQSVDLVVAHQEKGGTGRPAVTVTAGDGTTTCDNLLVPITDTLRQDRLDLTACGITTPEQLANLSLTYTANLASGETGTAALDGMWLQVQYEPPTAKLPAATATSSSTANTAAFSNPDRALEPDESPTPLTADVSLPSGGRTSASIRLDGFVTSGVPDSSQLGTAKLQVRHQEQSSGPYGLTPTVTVSGPGLTQPCTSTLPVRAGALTTDTVDLGAECGFSESRQLDRLRVTYTVAASGDDSSGGIERLDGITLVLDQTPSLSAPPSTQTTPAASSTGETPFGNPAQATEIDGNTSTGDLPANDTTTREASITLGGFDTSAIPLRAQIVGATLDVAHAEDSADLEPTVSLNGPGYSKNCADTPTRLPTNTGGLRTDVLDLVAACNLTNGAQLHDLAVTYRLSTGPGTTPTSGTLDGMRLSVSYETPASSRPTSATTPDGAQGFNNRDEATTIDGRFAGAQLTAGSSSASVALGGFVPPPPGSVITRPKLRVVHRETGATAAPVLRVTAPGRPSCREDIPLTTQLDTVGTDIVPVPASCLTSSGAPDTALVVTYSAALTSGGQDGSSQLDGITLDLFIEAPRLEPARGCTVASGFPGAGTCAMVQSSDDSPGQTRLLVRGSIYTPSAAVDLQMRGLDVSTVSGSIVARTINLGLTPAVDYPGALVGPAPSDGVTFTTYSDDTAVPSAAESATSTSAAAFDNPDAAIAIDDATSDARLPNDRTNASVALTGWSGRSPAGADDLVVLRVAHQEAGDVSDLKLNVSLPTRGGQAAVNCQLVVPVDRDAATPTTDTFNLTSADAVQPCGLPADRDLSALVVTYVASGGSGATARIDGMQLDLLSNPFVTATVTYAGDTATVTNWKSAR